MRRVLWLPLALLTTAAAPLATLTTVGPTALRERPKPNAKVLQTVEAGAALETKGAREGWVALRAPGGKWAFARSYDLTAATPAPPRPGEPAPAPPSSDASVLLEQLEAELAPERAPAALEARARADKRAP
jgi:hypothetical protein